MDSTRITDCKQVEQAASERLATFVAFFQNAPVAMLLLDGDRQVREMNSAAEETFAASAAELKGRRFGNAIRCVHSLDDPGGCGLGPDCQECSVRSVVADTFETGQTQRQVEARLVLGHRRDPSDKHVLVSTAISELPDGRQVLVCIEDITEHKQAKDALRQSHDILTEAQHIAHLGNWDWDIESNELNWSDEIYNIFGLSRQEFGATYPEFLNCVHADDRELVNQAVEEAFRKKTPYSIEHRIVLPDGSERIVHERAAVTFSETGQPIRMVGTVRDITERKQAESERNITVELLSRAGSVRSLHELLSGITSLLQHWSGCEAVGIRLHRGDDYPYYETRGFSPEFVLAESSLCTVNAEGRLLRDDTATPVLECMCGNVIRGRFDPKLPFFTEEGSFWSNNTSQLLASTTEADRQAHTRNRCNGEGYESVALIPLRAAGETLGLLQFNDRRKGMFSAVRIGLFERLGYNIATAVGQQMAVEALRTSEEKLRHHRHSLTEAQRIAHLGSWQFDYQTRLCTASEEALRIHGFDPNQTTVAYQTFLDLVHSDDREAVESAVSRTTEEPTAGYDIEYRIIRTDGTERFLHARGEVVCDEADKPVRMIGTTHDITEQKRAEQKLQEALQEIGQLKDRLQEENVYLREEISGNRGYEDIVGQSEVLRLALGKIEHVAGTDANVLLLGETGTGKELFARAIHNQSSRKDRPLVKVNCAALPSSLIESELFGHVKGAFTGALADKVGRFQLADGGTIFLDEIGELDPNLQTNLLRVLQEGEFERVGATKTLKVDVRVIAATNRDLQTAMEEGNFRPDLYYRLAVFPIELPSLRLHRDDIPLLAWHFIEKKQRRLGKTISKIPTNVMNALTEYDWPGNVRELENVLERAMILSSGPTLALEGTFAKRARGRRPDSPSCNLDDIDREHIVGVLEDCNWRIKGADNTADRLGLKPSTLRYRMKKLGIQRPPRRPR